MSILSATDFTVIQAEAHGVTGTRPDGSAYLARTLDSVAPGGWYKLLRPPPEVDPAQTLAFARLQVGDRYGFVTIGSIAATLWTPRFVNVMVPGTWICSALADVALLAGGWTHRCPDFYQRTPAQLMHACEDAGFREVELEQAEPGDVGFAHSSDVVAKAIRLAQRVSRQADWQVNHAFILDRVTTG